MRSMVVKRRGREAGRQGGLPGGCTYSNVLWLEGSGQGTGAQGGFEES